MSTILLGDKIWNHYDAPDCLCLVSMIWCIQIGYAEYHDAANCNEERYKHFTKIVAAVTETPRLKADP
jgi:hypothetical protein